MLKIVFWLGTGVSLMAIAIGIFVAKEYQLFGSLIALVGAVVGWTSASLADKEGA